MDKYEQFLNRWAAKAERLHRIGIHPYGYDPGFLCVVDTDPQKRGIEIPEFLADIICELVIKTQPGTKSDKLMIKAYRKRLEKSGTENERVGNG